METRVCKTAEDAETLRRELKRQDPDVVMSLIVAPCVVVWTTYTGTHSYESVDYEVLSLDQLEEIYCELSRR